MRVLGQEQPDTASVVPNIYIARPEFSVVFIKPSFQKYERYSFMHNSPADE
jgi:hypothetical protein